MSLFGKLFRSTPFDNPQVPMTADNVGYFLDLFGGGGRSDANEIVSPNTAMQLSTVYACVRILSEQVGKIPMRVLEVSAAGRRVAFDHPLFELLDSDPNPDMSAVTFKGCVTAQMLLWGAGYVEIIRNNAGQVMALWPRGAWATKPVRLNGQLAFATTDTPGGQTRYIQGGDMVHLPYVSLDGINGISPIGQARQALGTALALDKFGARFFGNYATPKIVLTVPGQMKPEGKTAARAEWEMLQSGVNQHRPAILDQGMDIKTMSIPPEDAQFLQSKGYAKREICSLYGVPPQMVGDLEKAIKSNVEQQGIEFLQYTLSPLLTRWTTELQRKLMPKLGRNAGRFVIAADTRELLRPDAASRQAFYQSGIQNGYLVPDEVREMESLNPYEGGIGQRPAIQLNMQPLGALAAAEPASVDANEQDLLAP